MHARLERVASVVQETVIEALVGGALADPRIGLGGMITVTRVRMAPDLSIAWVYVSMLEAEDAQEALAGLRSAARYLRGEVGRQLRARRTPELRFEIDKSVEGDARLEAVFREIREERERREGAAPEPEPEPEPQPVPKSEPKPRP